MHGPQGTVETILAFRLPKGDPKVYEQGQIFETLQDFRDRTETGLPEQTIT
jgi:hypothetical protein